MVYKTYKNEMILKHDITQEDFIPDGRYHFIYRLTYNKNGLHYYGSKTSSKEPLKVIGKSYFTSSKYVEPIFREDTKNFKIKIIKIFNNKMDKQLYESFIHKKFNVKLSNKFFNKSNQRPKGFDTTGMATVSTIEKPEIKFNIDIEEYKKNKDYYTTVFNNKVVVKNNEKHILIATEEFNKNRNKYETPSQNTVTCYDKLLDKHVQISSEEFFNNRENYIHSNENKVLVYNENNEIIYISSEEYKMGNYKSIIRDTIPVKNKITGETLRIHKDEFDKNVYETFNYGMVIVYDIDKNKSIRISKEHYYKNKEKYKCFGDGIPVTDIRTGEYKTISSEEYQNNKELYITNVHGTKKVIEISTDKIITINVEDYNPEIHKPMLSDYVCCKKGNKKSYIRYKDFKNGNYEPFSKRYGQKI